MKRIAVAICALSFALHASAQTFPKPGQPIRVLVGFAAGGTTDIQARVVHAGRTRGADAGLL